MISFQNIGLLISITLTALTSVYGQKFEEVSDRIGLDYYYPGHHRQEVGAGVTVLDINNDGWDDIFQSGGCFESKIWINNQGQFEDRTDEYINDSLQYRFIQGAVSADFDNDGYCDLILTNMSFFQGDKKPPILLKNINGTTFEQQHFENLEIIGHFPGASWGDVNGDGYIDLYILNYVKHMAQEFDSTGRPTAYQPHCLPNKLFINDSGRAFIEASPDYLAEDIGCGLASMFTDIDNDQDIDLILLNDFGSWNQLGNKVFLNQHPKRKFIDATDSLGFTGAFYGMGVGAGDVNFDGKLDYYFTNIGSNSFYMSGDNSYTNKSGELHLDLGMAGDFKSTSWSGLFFDIDNDLDLDLFVAKGYLESVEKCTVIDYNKLMLNNNGDFIDISEEAMINDSIPNRGAALLDFDHDGDLDIVVNSLQLGRGELAGTTQKIKCYENKTKNKNRWIAFELIGNESINRNAIGCSVHFKIDNKWYVREVDGGSGHSSQSTKTLYFGTGKHKKIEHIEIHWINAHKTVLTNIKTNKCYQVKPDGEVMILY